MKLSSSASDPFLSIIITLYTLILLYFPSVFLEVIFSGILILSSLLLFSICRRAPIQKSYRKKIQPQLSLDHHKRIISSESKEGEAGLVVDPIILDPIYAHNFVEWDVRAPLEVIYEENEHFLEEMRGTQMDIIEKYASLSKFYPETDSDSSSEEESRETGEREFPESPCFSWEVEERDGLIEIQLEENGYFEIDEENMIEIDLLPSNSPAK